MMWVLCFVEYICKWYSSFEGSGELKLFTKKLSNSRSTSTPSVEFFAGILALLRMSLKLSDADREVLNDLVDGAVRRGITELALCCNIVKAVRKVDVHAMFGGNPASTAQGRAGPFGPRRGRACETRENSHVRLQKIYNLPVTKNLP